MEEGAPGALRGSSCELIRLLSLALSLSLTLSLPTQVSYKHVVLCTVAAQRALQKRQSEQDFVLSATVRNGLLVYRPCNGALVRLCDQDWAKAMSLGVGTKRIPESWLSHRYSWLSDGVPNKPDFSLSSTISAVSDLI